MLAMSMRRTIPTLVLVLLSLGACELFENKVSKDKLEAELAKWLESNSLSATEIVCPDNQKMEKGNVFECNCKVGGIDVPVRVEVTNPSDGTVEWKTKYVTVKHEQIEAAIPLLPELAGRQIKVDCPERVLVSTPGSEWICNASDLAAPDVAMDLKIKFADGEGNYDWSLEPKGGAAPAPAAP